MTMSGDRRPLAERLLTEPYSFDWFQAVRVLERWARQVAPARPSAPVGTDVTPDQEHVFFRALASQAFPAAPLNQVRDSPGGPSAGGRERPSGKPIEAIVTFFGLTGPEGVLPAHYTSLLMRRIRAKDFALRDFLDMFNHRALSHFFRAWEKYQLPASFERAALDGETDPVTQLIFCLAGYGTGGLRGRLTVPDAAFLFYAGHFAHFPRSATALEGLLTDYFGLPVRLEQVVGQWLSLAEGDGSRMPDDDYPDGRNNELGLSVLIGERVWDVQSRFAVRLGPLRYEQFRTFMPDGDGLRELVELLRAYVGPEFDFEVIPLLLPTDAPPCILASEGDTAARLGWNAWVHDGDYVSVISDASFSAEELSSAGHA
jgi:type VI secretion system protein ImpH